MKNYTFELARTSTSKYLLAVFVNGEYAHYQTYKMSPYFERKIRETLYMFKCKGELKIPAKIEWDKLPKKDFLEAPACAASA